MKPTDLLMEEHRVIEVVLNCLEKMANLSLGEMRLDQADAKQAVEFIRNFADRCHHGKEEVHLFPLLERKGFPSEGGPTGVMRYEHEQGRNHVKMMDMAIAEAAQGNGIAVRQFAQHAKSFIALLREHIQKEDHCLFTMTNQALSEADQQELMSLFEQVESEEMQPGTHEKYLATAHDLAAKYGIEEPAFSAESKPVLCGCSH